MHGGLLFVDELSSPYSERNNIVATCQPHHLTLFTHPPIPVTYARLLIANHIIFITFRGLRKVTLVPCPSKNGHPPKLCVGKK